jgi:hypothetical protein
MEMRGFGTIFGADQSGTCDVGLDLQANILETAAKKLNKECILSISDCRVSIGCELESFGRDEIGALPPTEDLSGVSRWEATLAEKVIKTFSPKKGNGRSTNYREGDALMTYLGAGSSDTVSALRGKWTEQLGEVRIRRIEFCSTVVSCSLSSQ